MTHGFIDRSIPDPVIGKDQVSPGETIENLKNEVAQLKLEREKRNLEAELPSTESGPADLTQQLGLGALDPEVKAQAQRRAMSLASSAQGQAQGWLDRLLGTPEGVKVALDVLRGVNHNEGGGLGILKDLGIDLKALWERGQATKADSSFKVGGISLDGCALTPEVLASLIAFQQASDNLNYQKGKDDSLREGLQTIIKIVTDSGILSRLGGGIAGGAFSKDRAGRDISQEINRQPAGFKPFTCPKCQTSVELPAELVPGQEIKCPTEGCGETWTVYDEKAQPKPERQVKEKEVKVQEPEPPSCLCVKCGQLINLVDKVIGQEIQCPVCQEVMTVKSEDLAVDPQDPDPYGTRDQRRQFLRQ